MSMFTPVAPVDPFWAPAAWLRGACAAAISGYQRWISPHKGYCCAHRVLHKGESCSQYVKRVVGIGGVRQAFWLARERFQACRVAKVRIDRRQARASMAYDQAVRRAAAVPMVLHAGVAGADADREQRLADNLDRAETAADVADVASDLGLDPIELLVEGAQGALQAGGDVLAGGVDLLGSACEVLGPFADCAGGCSL